MTPIESQAASTSGPASSRKAFSFMKEPLNRTACSDVSTSFKIGAAMPISFGNQFEGLGVTYNSVGRAPGNRDHSIACNYQTKYQAQM